MTTNDRSLDNKLLCDAGARIAPAAPSFTVGRRTVSLLGTRIGRTSHWDRPLVFPHSHSAFEAVIILQGEALYLGQTEQPLRPGNLWVHPPSVVHAWREMSEHCLTFALRFTVQPTSPVNLPAQWPCCPEVVWLATLMAQAIRDGEPGWPEQVRGYLTALFVRIWGALGWEMESTPVETAPTLLARLDQFLAAELSAQLRAEEVAAALDLGLRSLQRYVKQATGKTLMERLQHLRLEKAAELLESTECPLNEIRRQVGIPDAAYFSRVFKERFGETPTGYRRKLKGLNS
ncbi:MAG: cupin domain-containing protein [Armatimonadota bacterium]